MNHSLSLIIAFLLGAACAWWLRRPKAVSGAAPASSDSSPDIMLARDDDLDAAIMEYVASNRVYHINDICRAIEHPKGARFVRAHFHQLMDEGKIRYRNSVYST